MKKPTSITKTPAGPTKQGHSPTTTQTTQALVLARATDHVATTGDVATVATTATTATDWAGFVPVATPCYLANVANPANAANFSGLALACTTTPRRGTIRPKAKAPACRNALEQVVAAPTVSGVLSCLNSWGLVRLHGFRMGYGRGGGYLQGRPHGLLRVTNRHAHPLPFVRQPVVPKSQQGAPTMQVNPMGQTAPTPKAAPAIPTTTDSEQMAHALLQAVTSTNLAGFYLRRDNVAKARRKLRQALQALHTLEVAHV